MYSSWPCPLGPGGTAAEQVLAFDNQQAQRLLILPPLFEEANKFRRQIFEIMSSLEEKGVDSFCPDLPGCNESLQTHRQQTLAGWRKAAKAAGDHFRATRILALRSAAWIAPADRPAFLLAPPRPAQVLRSMLRIHALALREAGKAADSATVLENAKRDGIVIAGWELGPALVSELESTEFSPSEAQTVIAQDSLGGTGLWLRSENQFDPQQAMRLVDIVTSGVIAS